MQREYNVLLVPGCIGSLVKSFLQVAPSVPCTLLTPIAPHSLSFRYAAAAYYITHYLQAHAV